MITYRNIGIIYGICTLAASVSIAIVTNTLYTPIHFSMLQLNFIMFIVSILVLVYSVFIMGPEECMEEQK